MKNCIKLALIGLALASAASFADDCTAPAAPTLPDGSTATKEQMLEGQKSIKDYQAANTAYRSCLEPKISAAEVAAAGDSPGPELVAALKTLNDDYNASVSKEEELAIGFNAELKKYKEANPQ
jgi:hypothetical protein